MPNVQPPFRHQRSIRAADNSHKVKTASGTHTGPTSTSPGLCTKTFTSGSSSSPHSNSSKELHSRRVRWTIVRIAQDSWCHSNQILEQRLPGGVTKQELVRPASVWVEVRELPK